MAGDERAGCVIRIIVIAIGISVVGVCVWTCMQQVNRKPEINTRPNWSQPLSWGWPSVRRLGVGNIADQLGCTPAPLTRSIAPYKTLAGSILPAACASFVVSILTKPH